MKPKVLWVEDGARYELASLCGPVFYKGTCDLTLAEDVSTAVDHLTAEQWDAVIVDVRLPPGVNESWRRLYRRAGADKVHAQLGLKLIEWLVRGEAAIHPEPPPAWVRPDRIAVFTVESWREVGDHLKPLGVDTFQQKLANLPDTVLEELIATLLSRT
jgi:hypothetical protein